MSSDLSKLIFLVFFSGFVLLFFTFNQTQQIKSYIEFSEDFSWDFLWDFDFDDNPNTPKHELVWENEISKLKLSDHGKNMADWLKKTYPEAPYMLHIANCESAGLIHKKDGQLLTRAGGSDSGVLQVLMRIHKPEMEKMGLNPNKNQDYFTYTRHLFDKYGTKPWNPSQHCWGDHYSRLAKT